MRSSFIPVRHRLRVYVYTTGWQVWIATRTTAVQHHLVPALAVHRLHRDVLPVNTRHARHRTCPVSWFLHGIPCCSVPLTPQRASVRRNLSSRKVALAPPADTGMRGVPTSCPATQPPQPKIDDGRIVVRTCRVVSCRALVTRRWHRPAGHRQSTGGQGSVDRSTIQHRAQLRSCLCPSNWTTKRPSLPSCGSLPHFTLFSGHFNCLSYRITY